MPDRSSAGELEILLVEDSADDRELTIHALRTNGLVNRIEVASDGEAALTYLFDEARYRGSDLSAQPRLILLDLNMPRVSGVEVLRRIKADKHLRAIPVVILTSSAEERDLVECYELGANSYIVKPVEFESFVEAITSVGMYWMLLNKAPHAGGVGDSPAR